MSLRINFNVSAVLAHHSLQNADRSLAISLERLSTGLRIQRSGDDPGGLTVANAMRHHLRGLDAATRNVEDGISMIQTAEGGLDQISALLLRARSLALHAANEGALDLAQRSALQREVDEIIGSVTRIASDTAFGRMNLLDGSLAQSQLEPAARGVIADLRHEASLLPGGIQAGTAITIHPADGPLQRDSLQVGFPPGTGAEALIQGLEQDGVILDAAVGSEVTVSGPGGSRSFTISATTTLGDLLHLINAATPAIGVRADYDATSGVFQIESTSFGSGTLAVSSPDMTSGLDNIGLFDNDSADPDNNGLIVTAPLRTIGLDYTDASGTTQSLTLVQDPSSTGGLTFRSLDGGPELAPPYSAHQPGAFAVTLVDRSGGAFGSQVDPADDSFQAIRVSRNRIHLGALTDQYVTVEIPDVRAAALGRVSGLIARGIDSLQAVADLQVLRDGNPNDALAVIDAAIDQIALDRGRLGAIQSNSAEATLSNLRLSIENLTAAESRIRDTDFALESAQFARHNIMLQAATSMLAQANQTPNTILQLLQ